MSDLLELPATVEELTAFNLRRWEEVLADPELRKVTGRVETDRFVAAGATEFWLCIEGEMRFYLADGDETVGASLLCPGIPGVVVI